jgi:hypothetical protein
VGTAPTGHRQRTDPRLALATTSRQRHPLVRVRDAYCFPSETAGQSVWVETERQSAVGQSRGVVTEPRGSETTCGDRAAVTQSVHVVIVSHLVP